jgi:anaerobic selenocysteine-containing dehydrogenase
MCHEATSVGLPESIGVGNGTVTLEDFDHCDALFCIGHNPGTNHPRMLTTLRAVSKRGVPIIVFNPLHERGLERFTSPQHPVEMLTLSSTPIASTYYLVNVGGDIAVLKGVMKTLIYPGTDEDPRVADREALTLTTIRSHDQYNTTIYGMNDRYRGITGRRDVVFVNEHDLASRGLKHGDLVDITVVPDAGSKAGERVMRNLTAVAYHIAQGSIAAYYPEANILVALDHYDAKSGTPSYKSTPVLICAS